MLGVSCPGYITVRSPERVNAIQYLIEVFHYNSIFQPIQVVSATASNWSVEFPYTARVEYRYGHFFARVNALTRFRQWVTVSLEHSATQFPGMSL